MAKNSSRSMSADMYQGTIDGVVKSLMPDRGGSPEVKALHERALSLQAQYSISDHLHSYLNGCMCSDCRS